MHLVMLHIRDSWVVECSQVLIKIEPTLTLLIPSWNFGLTVKSKMSK